MRIFSDIEALDRIRGNAPIGLQRVVTFDGCLEEGDIKFVTFQSDEELFEYLRQCLSSHELDIEDSVEDEFVKQTGDLITISYSKEWGSHHLTLRFTILGTVNIKNLKNSLLLNDSLTHE